MANYLDESGLQYLWDQKIVPLVESVRPPQAVFFKGSDTYQNIQALTTKEAGDLWNVTNAFAISSTGALVAPDTSGATNYDAGSNVVWTGSEWDAYGNATIDTSNFQTKIDVNPGAGASQSVVTLTTARVDGTVYWVGYKRFTLSPTSLVATQIMAALDTNTGVSISTLITGGTDNLDEIDLNLGTNGTFPFKRTKSSGYPITFTGFVDSNSKHYECYLAVTASGSSTFYGLGALSDKSDASGTVTNVSVSNPSTPVAATLSVTNPTSTPVITIGAPSIGPNFVWAGPTTSSGAASWRKLVAADLPSEVPTSSITTTWMDANLT